MSESNGGSTAKARVVFDLDGTLVDSAVGIQHIANKVLAQENKTPLSLEVTISFIGNGIATFIERMSSARNIPAKEHTRLFEAYNRFDAESDLITDTYPNVRGTLDELKNDNMSLGLCTNKLSKATHVMLNTLNMDHYFDSVVCGDTLDSRKPDPAMLVHTLDALPEGPSVYVGDSEVDAETAARAGIPFMLFTEGYRKTPAESLPHTRLFSAYSELPTLINSIVDEAN